MYAPFNHHIRFTQIILIEIEFDYESESMMHFA